MVIVGNNKWQLGEGQPQAAITFKKPRLFWQLALQPSLTFGDGYMSGDIEVTGDLLAVLRGFYQSKILTLPLVSRLGRAISRLPTSVTRGIHNAQRHYDIGNEFYRLWLDPSRTYSCAYFPHGNETLAEAQRKKLDLIGTKLRLAPGLTMLDIGCGWGSLLFHVVEEYGITATGITPAQEQVAYIQQEAKRRGLSGKIHLIAGDWRSLPDQKFDRIVSIGMFEHVGRLHYRAFLHRWQQLLSADGVSLLHTISRRVPGAPDPWIRKHIFPGGYLPTLEEIVRPAAAAGLRIYRVENLRPHYARTLAQWADNFTRVRAQVTAMFNEQFARKWWLYLQGSEAGFRWGALELWQVELYGPRAVLPLNRDASLLSHY